MFEITPTAPNFFNDDDKADILWRNTNGDVELWNSNSGSASFAGQNLEIVGGDWQIAGTGDFNGASEAGVLWRNADGDTELWNANGSGGFVGQDLGVVPTSWQVAGTGEFKGEGVLNGAGEGILWRNSNGDTELWNPNGSGGFVGRPWRRRNELADRWNRRFHRERRRQHSVAQHGMATLSCGTQTAQVALPARILGSSPQAGRSPEPAISPEMAKPALCGATPTAIRNCGIPTARADSLARI